MSEETGSVPRRIVLTGGTTGIGRATLRMLAGEGARLLTVGRHLPELDEALAHARQAGAEVDGIAADMAEQGEVDRLFARADEVLGGLDALVCCAAVGSDPLAELDPAEWRYVVATNLMGTMACAQAAVERMRAAGGGQIVLVGSISAEIRKEGESVYTATKAGIQAFAEALRKEHEEDGIRVTVIEPGAVATPMQQASPEEMQEKIAATEMLKPEDIARAIRWTLLQPPRVNVVQLRIEPLRQQL